MYSPVVSIIVAMSENRVIGRDGDLPWHISTDLKRFKQITTGHTVIMGRKTYESVGKPLPNRTNIVITRQLNYNPAGVSIAASLDNAMKSAEESEDEIFIIGGGEIYKQAVEKSHRLYLTIIQAEIEGDTFFPEINEEEWKVVEEERHPADKKNDYPFTFKTLERV